MSRLRGRNKSIRALDEARGALDELELKAAAYADGARSRNRAGWWYGRIMSIIRFTIRANNKGAYYFSHEMVGRSSWRSDNPVLSLFTYDKPWQLLVDGVWVGFVAYAVSRGNYYFILIIACMAMMLSGTFGRQVINFFVALNAVFLTDRLRQIDTGERVEQVSAYLAHQLDTITAELIGGESAFHALLARVGQRVIDAQALLTQYHQNRCSDGTLPALLVPAYEKVQAAVRTAVDTQTQLQEFAARVRAYIDECRGRIGLITEPMRHLDLLRRTEELVTSVCDEQTAARELIDTEIDQLWQRVQALRDDVAVRRGLIGKTIDVLPMSPNPTEELTMLENIVVGVFPEYERVPVPARTS